MKMTEERKRAATAALLSRKGSAILGFPVKVIWLDNETDLGYTIGERKKGYAAVHVAWDFKPITVPMGLNENDKAMLRMGVFAHELLHQVLTDFKDTYAVCSRLGRTSREASIFMQIMNILEDPAIEHQADSVFGGILLKALRYSIVTIYKSSPDIDDSPDAFTQLMNALINFGDMGVVRGHFTYPEAYEYFLKVAPIYNEGIDEKDPKKRVDISYRCFRVIRPLWEKYLQEREKDRDEMQKALEELLKQLSSAMDPSSEGKGESSDSDNGDNGDSESPDGSEGSGRSGKGDDSPETERRKKLLEDIKKAVEDGGKMPEDGKIPYASADSSEQTENDDTDSHKGSASSEKSEDNPEEKKGNSSQSDSSDRTDDGNSSQGQKSTDSDMTGSVISEDDIAEMKKLLEKEDRTLEQQKKRDNEDSPEDVVVEGSALDMTAVVKNVKAEVREEYSSEYADIVRQNTGKIKKLSRTLGEIFAADKEKCVRSRSGRYNIMRGATGTSARIFDRRRDPGNKKDCEVMLLVDMSASMSSYDKYLTARETAIIFGEALMALKVPHYIMGFTSDVSSAEGQNVDAYHTHFVTWNSSKRQHEALVGIEPVADNFDSYAIRNAKAILDKRNAKNKLLIVISDGSPAAMIYSNGRPGNWYKKGIAETTKAIQEARKSAAVLGIAIGKDCEPEVLQKMYGSDFIHIEDNEGLTNALIKCITKIVKDRFR